MSAAELWRGLGGWRFLAYSAASGVVMNQLGWWLFPDQRLAGYTMTMIASAGAGWAYARYRRALHE